MVERNRILQFDGLRALAFLAVFGHHAVHVPLAWIGVDLFFVLSGFLITQNLCRLRDSSSRRSALATFFYRRLLRIVAPYYVALIAITAVHHIAARDAAWYFAFASNIRDVTRGLIGGPYSPMWSIAVEEQFYLIWPWVVLFCPRRRLWCALVVMIAGAPLCRLAFAQVGFEAVYRLLPCRMDLLGFGALLGSIDDHAPTWSGTHRHRLAAAAVVAVTAFAVLSVAFETFRTSLNRSLFNVVGFELVAVFCVSIVGYVRGTEIGPAAVVLRNPVLRYVGRISYAGYLSHPLALDLVTRLRFGGAATAILALGLTLGFSTLSWYALERPLQRLRGLVLPTPARGPNPMPDARQTWRKFHEVAARTRRAQAA